MATQPDSRETLFESLQSGTLVALRLLVIPAAVVGFLAVALLMVVALHRYGMVSGTFFAIAVIGCLGALGGSVAAAQEGLFHFPHYDLSKRTMRLGSLQECMFGAVGAYAIFLVTPGISEEVLSLGELTFPATVGAAAASSIAASPATATQAGTNAAATTPAEASRGTTGGSEQQQNKPSVDWIELIAIALVGGYAGRAVITRTMMLYVTKEDVDRAKEEITEQSKEMVLKVQQELDAVVRQRTIDHQAMKSFHDQADIHTPPPPREGLVDCIRAASPTIHADIYVESRRIFHTIINMAAMSPNAPKEQELKVRIAERMIPIMQVLCDLDPAERFRGCRYGLSLALHLLGQNEQALPKVRDAIRISRLIERPVPPEYDRLHEMVERALAGLPITTASEPTSVTVVLTTPADASPTQPAIGGKA
ncbi:MAG: hypothetical protein WD872_20450 [Pirellulaceae bacterium]